MESQQNQDVNVDFNAQINGFANMEVFATDFVVRKSRYKLTDAEIKARQEWNQERSKFVDSYCRAMRNPSYIGSVAELLESTILPPPLSVASPSARSNYKEQRSSRMYPPNLEEWTDFEKSASTFDPTQFDDYSLQSHRVINVLDSCCSDHGRVQCRSETQEQQFLQSMLWNKLAEASFMQDLNLAVKKEISTEVYGLPDEVHFVAVESDGNPAKPAAVVEMKSSHNLLLPGQFNDLKQKYEEGFEEQKTNQSQARNANWSQIGHPLAQTLAYMIDNNCRYSALCSASKTYFIFLDSAGSCRITRAWKTCEKHFIRAWAYFLHLAKVTYEGKNIEMPQGWLDKTPIKEEAKEEQSAGGADGPNDDNDGKDGKGRDEDDEEDNRKPSAKRSGSKRKNNLGGFFSKILKSSGSSRGKKASSKGTISDVSIEETERCSESADGFSVPPTELDYYSTPPSIHSPFDFEADFVRFVPLSDISFGKKLGSGSNGDVLEASFEGKEVAVKQFDLSKRFESYENEVKAFKFLHNAWGVHIPTPIFVAASKSGNVRFLGMEKGQSPAAEDHDDGESLSDVYLKKVVLLEKEFKFRHLDVWSNSGNFVLNETGNVLVIDLEHWEEVV